MYFWKAGALAAELRDRKVSQREKMKYYLGQSVVIGLLVPIASWTQQEPTPLVIVGDLITIPISILGILFCYSANRRGDDTEFLDRIICISWPIAVRLVVILVGFFVVYVLAGYAILGERFDAYMEKTTAFDVVLYATVETIYYLWVRSYLLKISGAGAALPGIEHR